MRHLLTPPPLMRCFLQLQTAPRGVPVSVQFFGHDPSCKDYKDANKIKTLDMHPSHPWVATADEVGNVTVWDYQNEAIVLSFPIESLKESQKSAVETLESHYAFASANDVATPDIAAPGLGLGVGSAPGATAGSGTETFIASAVEAVMSGAGLQKKRTGVSGVTEDVKTAKTGHVRGIRFADEHVLAWACGDGRGDYDGTDVHGRLQKQKPGQITTLAASLDDLDVMLSPAVHNEGNYNGRPQMDGPSRNAPHAWLIICCEHRVLLLDYITRAAIDIPHSALLIEASGPSGLQRTVTKGKPGVHSASLLGPGVIAFGCEDGTIRIWSADQNAVIQVVRPPGVQARPITHLHTVATLPHAAGSTAAMLSSSCSLGSAARLAGVRLVSGCVDGSINVWEVMGGRMVLDNGRGGMQAFKLTNELVDLSVGPITTTAVALSADKTIYSWDISAQPPGGAGQPRMSVSRCVTSSTAAEGGVASRLMAAVPMGSHPALPPSCALVVGKGPHLELALVGCQDKAAESGSIIYDLRTCRPGLPTKLKVYTLGRHPFRPDTVAAGTNIGIFVFHVAPAYTSAAMVATHPSWSIQPAVTNEPSVEKTRVREGRVSVYVNAAGMLMASEMTVTSAASEEDEQAGLGPCTPLQKVDGVLPRPQHAKSAGTVGLDISSREHLLLHSFAPSMPPPSVLGPKELPGQPAPPPNALATIFQLLRTGVAPGGRGVKLRVSGSGRYLSAVWPEHKCYAVYKLLMPVDNVLSPVAAAEVGTGSSASSGHDNQHQDSSAWQAEYVEGGTGIDVAWSGHTIGSFDDKYAREAAEQQRCQPSASIGHIRCYDRFLVLEPGQIMTGRGPMGGGMAIGSQPTQSGGNKSKSKDKGVEQAAKVNMTPSVLVLKQLPVYDDPSIEVSKAKTLVPDLGFQQEPLACWGGGPCVAIALANDTSLLASNPAAALASGNCQFFSWNVIEPEQHADGGGAGSSSSSGSAAGGGGGSASDSRYSGASKSKGSRPRLTPIGGTSGLPAPSVYGMVSGCGVKWNAEGNRMCVCTPFNVHLVAAVTPRRLAASGGTGNSGTSKSGAPPPPSASMVELCRVPLVAASAEWHGSSLFVTTVDSRLVAILPPVLDPHLVADGSPAPMSRSGSRMLPVVLDLQSQQLPSSFPAALAMSDPLPQSKRGLVHVTGCVPVAVARSHLIVSQWTGARVLAGSTVGPGQPPPGITVTALPIAHPGLRACMAACGAGTSNSTSSTVSYLQSNVWASQWGSTLPRTAQTGLAALLAGLGCLPAALMLPGLSHQAGIGLCLARRSDVFDRPSKGFAAVDAPIIINYLRRLVRRMGEAELIGLSSCSGGGNSLGGPDATAAAEAEANIMPPIAQVAFFLAVAAQSNGTSAEHAAWIRSDLVLLAARLGELRLVRDAVLVASSIHSLGAAQKQQQAAQPLVTSAELIKDLLVRSGSQAEADARVLALGS